jgi:hypothetical protein
MKKNEVKKDESDALQEHIAWQENQYSPGVYTGGRLPPWTSHPRAKWYVGLLFLVGSSLAALIKAHEFAAAPKSESRLTLALNAIVITLFFLWGLKLIFRRK